MNERKFVALCRETIVKYVNRWIKNDDEKITEDDVYIVWLVKALKNSKAMVSTVLNDGMYYEITYNGEKNELYVDVYKKRENICISI